MQKLMDNDFGSKLRWLGEEGQKKILAVLWRNNSPISFCGEVFI